MGKNSVGKISLFSAHSMYPSYIGALQYKADVGAAKPVAVIV
jgi:hypothetical protein